jgi:hypothetical protein
LSLERARWQDRARYYYEDQLRFLRFLVPEGLKILEIGCGLGDQLAALKPKRGVASRSSRRKIDFSCRKKSSDSITLEPIHRYPGHRIHLAQYVVARTRDS